MNKKIQDMAHMCWDQRLDGVHFDQEQFAQLIIKRCIAISGSSISGENAAERIAHYFGLDYEES
jgi:hypothetical protein